MKASLSSEQHGSILKWAEERMLSQHASVPEDEMRAIMVGRRDAKRLRLQELYKLRNDVVHAGYDDEGVAEVMYGELRSLFGSFTLNLAYNCVLWKTYDGLLDAIDQEWLRGRETQASLVDEEVIRKAAFSLWEQRGRPFMDDMTDWFNARRSLGLE